jgi:hypothetical protein
MLSQCGEGLALLNRIQTEGHECDFWSPANVPADLYEGIIPRIDDWRDGLDDDVIVLFDSPGSGRLAEQVPTSWGTGPLNDVLHFDRAFGSKVAKIHGLKVAAWGRFAATGPAIEYLQPDKGRWDLELPNGQLFYEDQTARQMSELLEFSEPLTDFYLVEHITGRSLTLAGWYVDGELVPNSLFSTIERRRFLAGDYGPLCPTPQLSMGWFWPPKRKREGETTPTLYRHTLKKLEPFLEQHNYQGPLCLRLRIGEADGIPSFYGFETGFRYPAIYAMLEGIEGELAEKLLLMAQGQMPELKVSYDWIGAMAISVPPYPYYSGRANHLVRGELNHGHIWPLDVKLVAGYNFTAGAHGIIAHVTARSRDHKGLTDKLLELSQTIGVSDKQVRSDGLDGNDLTLLLTKWHYF